MGGKRKFLTNAVVARGRGLFGGALKQLGPGHTKDMHVIQTDVNDTRENTATQQHGNTANMMAPGHGSRVTEPRTKNTHCISHPDTRQRGRRRLGSGTILVAGSLSCSGRPLSRSLGVLRCPRRGLFRGALKQLGPGHTKDPSILESRGHTLGGN